MTALILILVALVAAFVLWRFQLLPFGKAVGGDAAAALRELLLARAEGRIGAEEFEQRQAALHAALLAAPPAPGRRRAALWAVPAVVAVAAVLLYVFVDERGGAGVPAAAVPEPPLLTGSPMEPKGQAANAGDLNTMVKRLAEKMEKDPNNGEGWLLLARTYGELRQPEAAAKAYARAAALLPPDANLLADWADAHVVAHGRKWDDAARDIVKRALAADPKHLKALALAGSEAFERGDHKSAIGFWKRMQAAAPADSMDAKLAEANIQEATAAMGGKKGGAGSGAQAGGAAIAGVISLDARLRDKVAPGDTVFVVAKGIEGGGAPLAAQRYTAGELPIRFVLDDSMAMVPGRTLSGAGEVVVTARLSKSGDAKPQPGDFSSVPVRARPGQQDLKLELVAGK